MTVSSAYKAAFFAQQTNEVLLAILEISHADITTIRVVNNTENITSGGDEYIAFPFECRLPNLSAEDIPRATINICNVDRQIVQAVRSISSRPDISLSLILASDPDTIEVGPFDFKLADVDYDVLTVGGSLTMDDFFDETYPGDRFTPGQYAGLF